MVTAAEKLANLQVADVMTENVVTVTANNTMSEAADAFLEHQITGAPVVDEQGRCVGVLSASDFVHSKAEELEGDEKFGDFQCSRDASGVLSIDQVRHDLVRQHMTPAVQTVDIHSPLLAAAKCMCSEHVHRLIVIDERSAPLGILTSLDLVKALTTALEDLD